MHVKRRNNILRRVKGFQGGRKKLIKLAKVAETKAGAHAYRDRRVKKRQFRNLWNIQINAAIRPFGMSYSKFMGALKTKNIALNRKMLAALAAEQPVVFESIVKALQ